MSACFFIGHREAPDSLLPELSAEIERHIVECGVTDFLWADMAVLMHWQQIASKRQRRATRR